MSDNISPIGFMQARRAAREFVRSIDGFAAGLNEPGVGGGLFSIEDARAQYGREQYPHCLVSTKPPTEIEAKINAHAKRVQSQTGR